MKSPLRGLQRKLLRDFRVMGMQVFMIALLIVGAVSVLVSSWSSYQSLQKSKEQFYSEFQFADIFSELVRAPIAISESIRRLAGIQTVEVRLVKDGLVDVRGQAEPALGHFVSWSGEHQVLNGIYLRQGRLPQRQSQIEVVVHEAFAKAHHLQIGDKLSVMMGGRKRQIEISGIGLSPEFVYALSPIAPLPDDKHFGIFWMRLEDLQNLTAMDGAFNSLQVKLSEGFSTAEAVRQIEQLLQPYGHLATYSRSRQLSHIFVEDEIRQQRVMAVVMPSIFLGVAMFILNVILSRLIALHRGQIATLKSLGYSSMQLTLHYFQLVTLILLTGTVPAIFIGRWIGHWYAGLYQDFFRFPSIDFSLSVEAIVFGFAAGLVPGWIGALSALYKVSSLQPAEALRPPAPASYQMGVLERWGLLPIRDIFSKIIFRSLFDRPWRLAMSVLGMAAALAILVNGAFWTDVIDAMMDRQFRQMRREDLTVRLVHPKGQNVITEMLRIPGIIFVEGERTVPVRFHFKNFSKEVALLGWQGNSQLSRVLTKSGQVVKPPEGGVLLSRYFEKAYKVNIGDRVELRTLQGLQRDVQVTVMGFVDDMVGQQVYASAGDLARWLKEEPVFDTLQVRVDPALAEKIYVELKEKPEVAGISIRRLLLKSFTETVAGMILTFTGILYLFAVAIAGAVMYNSARIGFSERSWELASMRILGIGTRETFEVLFVDIGLQVILALVPGLFLGYGLSYLSTEFIHNDTFSFPLVINYSTYGAAILVLLLTFLASGIFLYKRIRALDFTEALKARE